MSGEKQGILWWMISGNPEEVTKIISLCKMTEIHHDDSVNTDIIINHRQAPTNNIVFCRYQLRSTKLAAALYDVCGFLLRYSPICLY